MGYPRLEDLLVIGEQVLDVPAKDLAKVIDIARADSTLASIPCWIGAD